MPPNLINFYGVEEPNRNYNKITSLYPGFRIYFSIIVQLIIPELKFLLTNKLWMRGFDATVLPEFKEISRAFVYLMPAGSEL